MRVGRDDGRLSGVLKGAQEFTKWLVEEGRLGKRNSIGKGTPTQDAISSGHWLCLGASQSLWLQEGRGGGEEGVARRPRGRGRSPERMGISESLELSPLLLYTSCEFQLVRSCFSPCLLMAGVEPS